MAKVFSESKTVHAARLTMLAIADNADEKGRAFPSVATIASKARISERAVQMSIRECEKLGELIVKRNEGPSGCHVFIITLGRGADIAPPANSAGVQSFHQGGAKSVSKGAKTLHRGGENFAPKPSVEPSVEPSVNHQAAFEGMPESLNTEEFRATWQEFIDYRKENRFGTLKPISIRKRWEEMATWGESAAVAGLKASIANGWRGVFPPKANGRGNHVSTRGLEIRPEDQPPSVDLEEEARKRGITE